MCSKRWAVPEIPVHSSTPPARKCVTKATVGAPSRRRNRKVMPLGSTYLTTGRRSPGVDCCAPRRAALARSVVRPTRNRITAPDAGELGTSVQNIRCTSSLASCTERRLPAIDGVRFLEFAPTDDARPAPSSVDLQLELEPARRTGPRAVIAHRRAGSGERAGQHARHGGVQARELLERERRGALRRSDLRLEQRLVRVDIAHAGEPPLGHTRLLDRAPR